MNVIESGIEAKKQESGEIALEKAVEVSKTRFSGRSGRKFKRFQKLYLTCPDLTPTQIALKCYNCASDKSASAIASENLKKLGITRLEVLEREGLTDLEDAKDLSRLRKAKKIQNVNIVLKKNARGVLEVQDTDDFIEVDDNFAQLKALELTYKIKGAFVDKDAGPDTRANQLLMIIENINVAQITAPGKGVNVGREQSPAFSKFLEK